MKSFFKEFETFAVRGNAIDLAIGVVIGAAFNQVTTTLATNVLTPPIGLLIGGFDFSKLALPLGGSATIQDGLVLQAVLNFILIAFALFLIVKLLNRLTRKRQQEDKKAAGAAKPVENEQVTLLREIRDELKKP
jgi:large conductance mechanosensitive channel